MVLYRVFRYFVKRWIHNACVKLSTRWYPREIHNYSPHTHSGPTFAKLPKNAKGGGGGGGVLVWDSRQGLKNLDTNLLFVQKPAGAITDSLSHNSYVETTKMDELAGETGVQHGDEDGYFKR